MATLNNVIANANGSVGIGTSIPTQLLELKKTTGSSIALLNYNDSVKFNINASSGGAGYVGMVTNHDLIFVTNDTERARLNTNGNLGIGSSSPAYKLDVTGEMRQSGNNFWFSGARMAGDGSGNIDINYNNGSSPSFTWYNGGTSALARITSGGSLGIGTTSPTQLLDVRGNIKLGGDNSGNYVYYVTDIERTIVRTTRSDVSQEGLLRSDGWGNFTFNKSIGLGYSLGSGPQTGNIYAAGSVGIGTSTTTSGLQIQTEGTNTTSGSFLFVRSTNASFGGAAIGVGYQYAAAVGNNFTPFRIRAGTTNAIFVVNSAGVVYAGDTTGAVIYGNHDPYYAFNQDTNTGMDLAASDTLTFKTGGTERVRIASDGNVGIGTTSPGYKLEVLGLVNVVSAPGSYGAMFRARDSVTLGTESFGGVHFTSSPGTDYTIGKWTTAAGAGLLQIRDQSGNKFFTIDGAGNVGIGTTTLSSLLTLNGTYPQIIANNPTTGSGVVIQLRDNGRDAGFMGHSTTTARLQFGSRGSSAVHMTIGETGNIGIGTTNPGNNLVVYNGSGWAGTDLNGSSGGELRFLQSGTLKANIYASTSTGFVLNGGSEIIFQNGASEKMRLTGGNLGIGTTSPVALLDVRGSTKFGSSLSNTHQFTGSVNFGGSTYNNSIAIDKFEYFSLQPYIEGGSFPSNVLSLSGTYPTFVTMTGSACPFGKVAYNVSYYEAIGDFIPVQAGETLYGEIWAYRTTSATGTAGFLYCGIARYDKDKKPLDANAGLNYFIASAVTVPTTSTWTKYGGTTTLPLTHTPYNGSDGGPARYVRPYIIVDYPSGTIPTYWAAFKIRKQQLTRDAGATTISGSLGIGTSSPSSILHTAGAGDQVVRFTHTDNVVGRALTLRLTNNNATYLNSGAYVQAIQGAGIDYYSLAFGTTNNSTTSAERMRIQFDGNVGIGTTSPGYKLDVISGSMRVASAATASEIYFGTLDGTNIYLKRDNNYDLSLVQNASSGNALYLAGAGNVYLSIDSNNNETDRAFIVQNNSVKSGTELFRVNEAGNVGIGSSSPSAKLDVVDTGNFFVTRDANAYPRFTVTNGSAQLGLFRTGTSAGGFYIGGDASLFSVWDSSFSRLVNINTSGNIGINVPSPLTKLDIANTQANGITMRFDTTTNYQAWIRPYWNSSTDTRIDFAINRTSGATPDVIMSVGYGGNVGIGTTNPSALLNIVTVNGSILYDNSAAGGSKVRIGSTGIAGYITEETSGKKFYIGTLDTDIRLNTGNGVSAKEFVFSSSGSLGIGTTSALSTLHLTGPAPTILTLSSTSYPSTFLSTFGVDSGARAFLIFGNNGENQIRAGRTTTGGYLDFYTNNTVAQTTLASDGNFVMRLTSTGNVGIGTQTTSDKLEVEGGIRIRSANSLTLRNSANDSSAVIYNGFGAGGSTIYLAVGPSPTMVIGNSVGIGTTSPGGLLHNYRATSTATPITYLQEAAASPSKTNVLLIERLNNLNATSVSASSAGVRIRDHSSNYGLSVEDHSGNSYLVVRGGGNVGIGTAIPTSKLNAYGSGSNLSVFKAEGGNGTLFEITDTLTGSLFSVNTIAGLPVMDVISNYRTNIFGPTAISASINTNSNIGCYIVGMGSTTNAQHALNIIGYNQNGGTGYQGFMRVTNTYSTATNPNKYFRLNSSGTYEIVNSAYTNVILSLTDAGVLSTPGGGTSDIRTKNNIEYIDDSVLPIINKLKPASFEFKDNPNVRRHGFIAQDVLPVKPDLVLGDGYKEDGIYGLDYDGILALTVKALQEANAKIEQLEARISQLENK